jgi:hypothetical protein
MKRNYLTIIAILALALMRRAQHHRHLHCQLPPTAAVATTVLAPTALQQQSSMKRLR